MTTKCTFAAYLYGNAGTAAPLRDVLLARNRGCRSRAKAQGLAGQAQRIAGLFRFVCIAHVLLSVPDRIK